MLLLRELGGGSDSSGQVIPLISPHHRAIAPDMRCAGRSEKPLPVFEISDVANDITALLDSLGIGSIDVVGAALGAMVAAVMASQAPQRVRHMVLCAVTDVIDQRTRDYLNERAGHLRTAGMRDVVEPSLANAFPERHAPARARYRPIYLANDPAAYAALSQNAGRDVDNGSVASCSLSDTGHVRPARFHLAT